MLKHLYIILVSTFLVGFVAGVYVHFISRAEPDIPGEATSVGFVVTGDEYGGCEERGCASYRISGDGSYVFLLRRQDGADVRTAGTLSDERVQMLRSAAGTEVLERITESRFSGVCPAENDKTAYRFTVRVDGVHYSVDSCQHRIVDAALFRQLIEYFDIFRAGN